MHTAIYLAQNAPFFTFTLLHVMPAPIERLLASGRAQALYAV